MITKKGQGISINMIVIAAIALLVLVVMAILVFRSGSDFSDSSKCVSKGGLCKSTCDSDKRISTTGENAQNAEQLCDNTGICCSPVPRV